MMYLWVRNIMGTEIIYNKIIFCVQKCCSLTHPLGSIWWPGRPSWWRRLWRWLEVRNLWGRLFELWRLWGTGLGSGLGCRAITSVVDRVAGGDKIPTWLPCLDAFVCQHEMPKPKTLNRLLWVKTHLVPGIVPDLEYPQGGTQERTLSNVLYVAAPGSSPSTSASLGLLMPHWHSSQWLLPLGQAKLSMGFFVQAWHVEL